MKIAGIALLNIDKSRPPALGSWTNIQDADHELGQCNFLDHA